MQVAPPIWETPTIVEQSSPAPSELHPPQDESSCETSMHCVGRQYRYSVGAQATHLEGSAATWNGARSKTDRAVGVLEKGLEVGESTLLLPGFGSTRSGWHVVGAGTVGAECARARGAEALLRVDTEVVSVAESGHGVTKRRCSGTTSNTTSPGSGRTGLIAVWTVGVWTPLVTKYMHRI
jgi:hypothetical protein